MSKVFNMVGGGGGPYASIFVTGLSETDTVTAVHKKTVQVPNPDYIGLPDEYTQLEYIQSTGTQYIDTGVIPNTNSGYEFDVTINSPFSSSDSISTGSIIGCYNALDEAFTVSVYTNRFETGDVAFGSGRYAAHLVIGSRMQISLRNHIYTTSTGGTETISDSLSATISAYLFASHDTSVSGNIFGMAKAIMYSAKMYDGGTIIRNYIPAKRISDSAIGLYDLVNNVFYTNAGTGTFTAGSEIPAYIEMTVDDKTLTGKWATIQKMVDAQIPTMTSNTTPSGVVSSTSDYSDEYSAWKAFDGKETSTPGWAPSTDADLSNTYCQYEFNESVNPKEIRIGFGGNGFTFDVKASSDGVNFVTLASNISNSKDAWSIVNVESDEYYKYYRFYMVNATAAPSSGYGQKFNIIGTKLGAVSGHMIKPIRDFGTWTVTATDGTDTYTQDVLVDVITEYEIEITKKLYLYRDGDECEDVTGGWSNSGYLADSSSTRSATKNNDSIYFDDYLDCAGTANSIGLSPWSKLCAEITHTSGTEVAQPWVGYSAIKNLSGSMGRVSAGCSASGTEIVSLDISSVNEARYVMCGLTDNNQTGYVHKVWLE